MRVYVVFERYDNQLKWIKNIYLSRKSAEKFVARQTHSGFNIEEYKVFA